MTKSKSDADSLTSKQTRKLEAFCRARSAKDAEVNKVWVATAVWIGQEFPPGTNPSDKKKSAILRLLHEFSEDAAGITKLDEAGQPIVQPVKFTRLRFLGWAEGVVRDAPPNGPWGGKSRTAAAVLLGKEFTAKSKARVKPVDAFEEFKGMSKTEVMDLLEVRYPKPVAKKRVPAKKVDPVDPVAGPAAGSVDHGASVRVRWNNAAVLFSSMAADGATVTGTDFEAMKALLEAVPVANN